MGEPTATCATCGENLWQCEFGCSALFCAEHDGGTDCEACTRMMCNDCEEDWLVSGGDDATSWIMCKDCYAAQYPE